ncbi:MAG: outer membrane lipoprotein-sorting protein [Candidatus Neomarinimicrobiota bacterium]|tara:strand:+ start:148 stop:921 length:774 start_codon:yes stop_codon:yes gene_type:complete
MIIQIIRIFLISGFIIAQDLTPEEILSYVASHPKPETSITEIKLEITRKKKRKIKTKIREFTRYEKFYNVGIFKSKSLARFHKPKIVKGTGFLSWVYANGKTDQWFSLPKIKKAKKVKAKEKSKTFLNTDFTYEDLENRDVGSDSLMNIGNEYYDGVQCKVIMAWPKDVSSYFSRKIWVNSQTWRISKVEYYISESNKDKTLYVSDFIIKNGFSIAGRMIMEKENGNKTIMSVMSYKPDMGLKDDIFTKDFLVKNRN